MSQIGFDIVGSDWVDASTLGTLASSSTYIVQNRGAGILLIVEDSSEPTTEAGMVLLPYQTLKITIGSDKFWLKSLTGSCAVNIIDA